jgi:lysophospholipase L1-like esterase
MLWCVAVCILMVDQMSQINILCYGDSNTWGYVPQADHASSKMRYPRNIRRPGVLQALLAEKYFVIEEGLNSRTTNLEHTLPPDRNGKTYLSPCLYSHAPIDLVILALGGNDTKTYFNRSAEEIKDGLAELVNIIQSSPYGNDMVHSPQILITTCVIPLHYIEDVQDENGMKFMKGAVKKSQELVGLYALLAKEMACHYLDLSADVIPSKIDGVHYDEAAHKKCAELISKKIIEIFE